MLDQCKDCGHLAIKEWKHAVHRGHGAGGTLWPSLAMQSCCCWQSL